MSNVVGELARVRAAFDQPTLTLLHRQQAALAVTLFRCCFSRDVTAIPTARLHQLIDNLLDDLRADGTPGTPEGSGRDLCVSWVKGRWLVRSPGQGGEEFYSLTSHAQTALTLVDGLSRERTTLSEHRITTILTTIRRFNADANPDRQARIRILDAQIVELAEERDRLEGGGTLEPVSPDFMLEGYGEVLSLVSALPSDFKRVEEAFEQMRRKLLAAFRAEEQPAGSLIDTYLRGADELMAATAEGRAFEGAFAVLRNGATQLQLREDITALLEHPMARDILTDQDRRELRGTMALIHRGIEDVLTQRSRATQAIKDYVQRHDSARDRELTATLRQLDAELLTWLERTGPRTRVPIALLPEVPDLTYLPRRFHDPAPQTPPPPLSEHDDAPVGTASLADMLAWGGPSLPALREALTAATAPGAPPGSPATLGEVFASLGADLQRPVEIFGLLHLAANVKNLSEADGVEDYVTLRPDGTTRTLRVPRMVVGRPAPDTLEPL